MLNKELQDRIIDAIFSHTNEYEVVEPSVGTVVPELPENDVEVVTIDGETYYEFDDILYKPLVTKEGVQYEVVGRLDD